MDALHIRDIVRSALGYVLIDTNLLFDQPKYETIVVSCNSRGNCVDWKQELDLRKYDTIEEARKGHLELLDKWEVH